MLAKRLHENKLKRALVSPFRGIVKTLSPTSYVKYQYQYITHHKLNLKNPVRYTEKLQYLRLYVYPKDDEVSRCAGRVGVREYLKELGLEQYLVPIYGVYDSFDDIDFDKLPESFVMKCSHASGFNQIVYHKKDLDLEKSKEYFEKCLHTDYGKKTMERHYSKIKPQIIIEKLLMEDGHLPIEYKIHVYNGKARNLYVVTNRGKDIRYTQYYIDWAPFDGSQFNGWLKSDTPLKKPDNFDEMVVLAESLAKRFPFVRVDLYDVNGKVYFSEMTFTPAKGTLIFDDDEADFIQGKWLDISKYLKPNAK
ncbi:MAG: glycosyl transferase [Bacilli bacterium]|nr:glycosyl transferase [Bacilli bacterium]MCH4210565.1 glycosyl transferase [Bacilli bacterium]MCH4277411.1 glycosyl transferase [Bacilli bacterium]